MDVKRLQARVVVIDAPHNLPAEDMGRAAQDALTQAMAEVTREGGRIRKVRSDVMSVQRTGKSTSERLIYTILFKPR